METTIRNIFLVFITILLTTCERDFVNREFPSVYTLSAVPSESGTIIFTGNLINRNSAEISEVGFIWQINEDPLIKPGYKINTGAKSKSGDFQAEITNSIKKDSKYIVRAYTVSGKIKTYGEKIEFVPVADLSIILNKFEPTEGHAFDTILITGERFNRTISLNQVIIETKNARIIEVSDTFIKCVVPYGLDLIPSTIKVITNGFEEVFSEKFTIIESPLMNDLIAYYPFNGNALDESGNQNNGTISDATLTSDRFGNTNRAFSFDGYNSYIAIPPAIMVGLNDYTYSLWIRPNQVPSTEKGQAIFSVGDINIGICQGLTYEISTRLFAGSYNIGTNPIQSYIRSSQITPNQWTHVTICRDGSDIKMYINGNIISSTFESGTNGQSADYGFGSKSAIIGGRSNFATPNFNGKIDEVRVYNRVLSDIEISQLPDL